MHSTSKLAVSSGSVCRFLTNKWVLGVAIIALTVSLCIQPVKTSLASLNYYTAKPILDTWRADPSSISLKNFNKAKNAAEAAVSLHPRFAFYADVLSEVLRWGVYAGVAENKSAANTLARRLTHESLEIRPVWAITWANLAQMQWAESGVSSSYATYLNIASDLGGHLPEVHLVWATIGLELVNKDFLFFLLIQEKVKHHVLLGLSHPRAKANLLAIIRQNNMQGLVCSWLKASESEMINVLRALKCK